MSGPRSINSVLPRLTVGLACGLSTVIANAQPPTMTVQRIASSVSRPVFGTCAPGDANRMFIVEQHTGRIEILDLTTNTISPNAYLVVTGLSTGNEQGLLGLAFHPDYDINGFLYVLYTDSGGTARLRRYTRLNDNQADATSGMDVLSIAQPQGNHNGGWIGFGPDRFLYVCSGDGGGSDDNDAGHTAGTGNAQDITDNLLGKLLRIDVDGDDFPADPGRNYAIPSTNPFVGVSGDDEIFAYGLRNPWRGSFDSETGHFYLGDVGQNAREEIDIVLGTTGGGQNFGWRLREGMIATPSGGVGGPKPNGAVDPIYDYLRGAGANQGRCTIGGYVYRGSIEAIQGHYFFADYINNRLWSFQFDCTTDQLLFNGTNFRQFIDWSDLLVTDTGTVDNITSFAEDASGNLYVMGGSEIFKITSATIPAGRTLPDSFNVSFGNVHSGGLADLLESDDQYLQLNPVFSQSRYQQRFTIDGTASTQTPCEFKFVFEASIFNLVGTVQQRLSLYNFDTLQFELLDTRLATAGDSVVIVRPAGDLSRFVETGTDAVRAQVFYQNSLPFWVTRTANIYLPFRTKIDNAFWRMH